MNKKVNRGVSSLAEFAENMESSACPGAAEILSYVGLKIGRRFSAAQFVRLHQVVAALVAAHELVKKGLMEEVVDGSGKRGYRLTPKGREVGLRRMANEKAA